MSGENRCGCSEGQFGSGLVTDSIGENATTA